MHVNWWMHSQTACEIMTAQPNYMWTDECITILHVYLSMQTKFHIHWWMLNQMHSQIAHVLMNAKPNCTWTDECTTKLHTWIGWSRPHNRMHKIWRTHLLNRGLPVCRRTPHPRVAPLLASWWEAYHFHPTLQVWNGKQRGFRVHREPVCPTLRH